MSRVYQLLHVLEFSSSRKRMSVIVRNDENKILLLCKGADRFQLLSTFFYDFLSFIPINIFSVLVPICINLYKQRVCLVPAF
jgi:magnesium-transporting ATPase (P-type)